MILWRYESVIVNPSPIEIFATMTAFSPTLADAFWTLMTKEDSAPAQTTPVSATRARARLDTRRVTTGHRALGTVHLPRLTPTHRAGRLPRGATDSPGRKGSSRRLLRDREDPDHAARGDVLRPAEEIGQQPLLEFRVDAPTGDDADLLSPVDGKGHRGGADAGVRRDLPQHLPGARVEGAKIRLIRPACEDEPAGGGHGSPPVHRVGELVTPRPLPRVDVPGLDLAEVLRALVHGEPDIGDVHARPPLPGHVLLHFAFHEPAVVIVGRDEEASHLGVVGGRRPVFAAPERRTEVGALAGLWNPVSIVVGTAGLRIDALEHVLLDVRGGGDEPDPISAPLQQVQIAVARRVHQSLDRAPVLLIVEDERRVRLVPVPRLVPLVLEVALHLTRVGLDGDGGRGVKVVPRALIPEPGRSVPGAPVREAELRVIGPRQPDGAATTLPGVPGPGVVARLAGARHRVRLPRGLAALSVKGLHEAPDTELAAGHADHDLALRHERGERHVVASVVILDLLFPGDLACLGVEGDQRAVQARHVHLVAEQNDPPAGAAMGLA